MATMREVAERANVSIATVSFVVNDTKPVSPETRARIMTAMAELGYQRNAVARALASHRTRIVALLYPALDHRIGPTVMKFITEAASVARERGYDFVLWPVANDAEQMSSLLAGGLLDGVLLMEVQLDDARVDRLIESRVPFALIGRTSDANLPFVDIDFDATLEQALDYLTGLGHGHIALVNERIPDSTHYSDGPQVRGELAYREGMRARGLVPHVVSCEGNPLDGRRAATEVLRLEPRTTAILSMTELAVPGILSELRRTGLRVPADISVLGVSSSSEMGALSDPVLTTLNAPATELGGLGVTALIDQLEGNLAGPPQILLDCTLVIGESTGPAPTRSA
jgi:DNA-binding LacI/PurR family transcriptional regulator